MMLIVLSTIVSSVLNNNIIIITIINVLFIADFRIKAAATMTVVDD